MLIFNFLKLPFCLSGFYNFHIVLHIVLFKEWQKKFVRWVVIQTHSKLKIIKLFCVYELLALQSIKRRSISLTTTL